MKFRSHVAGFWAVRRVALLGFGVFLCGCSKSQYDAPPWMRGHLRLVARDRASRDDNEHYRSDGNFAKDGMFREAYPVMKEEYRPSDGYSSPNGYNSPTGNSSPDVYASSPDVRRPLARLQVFNSNVCEVRTDDDLLMATSPTQLSALLRDLLQRRGPGASRPWVVLSCHTNLEPEAVRATAEAAVDAGCDLELAVDETTRQYLNDRWQQSGWYRDHIIQPPRESAGDDLGVPTSVESPTFNDPYRSNLDSPPRFETPGDPGATTADSPPVSSAAGSDFPGFGPPPGFGVEDNSGLPGNLFPATEPAPPDNGFPSDIQAIIDRMNRQAREADEQVVLWDAEELKTARKVVFVMDAHCDNTWMDFASRRVDAAVAGATPEQKLELVTNQWWVLGRFAAFDPREPDTTLSLLRKALEHKPDLIYLITDRGVELDTALTFCAENSQSATLQVVLFAEGLFKDDRCLDFIAGQNRGKLLTVPPPKREGG